MGNVRFVGLDVHKESIAIALAEGSGGEPSVLATIPNDTALLLRRLRKLGPVDSIRCCYEAGPTGFGLCRDLRAAEIACMVVADASLARGTGMSGECSSKPRGAIASGRT